MTLACQRNCYLQELATEVISCTPSTLNIIDRGQKQTINGFEVELKDTVLFPEGGGQPDDRGTINGIPVLQIRKKKGCTLHFLETSLSAGDAAYVRVDWERRFDHMQQHTGQHLITALAECIFQFSTTSWNLGEETSFIELDTPSIKPDEIEKLQCIVNEKIRKCIPVTIAYFNPGAPELKKVRSRMEVPEDCIDSVRVVTIENIDANTCCGTHLSNLAHLQAIKLLYAEKAKKNKTNLYFIAGNRLLEYLSKSVSRERALTRTLTCGPEEHVKVVEKIQKALKLANKNSLNAFRDLAVLEARQFKQIEPRPPFFSLHKKDAEVEFLSIFANEVKDNNVVLFLTVGEDKGQGHMLLTGKKEIVDNLGPQICTILEGKGAGKNGRFQAKVANLKKRSEAECLAKETILKYNEK